ncbi:recombinase family protein [Pontibacter russatus]|uniref:recombinase family protein n=1 Tax=Pontibacter russatus TaxID=2694929 RepID=UPI00137A71D8|nr:recombinase family protein [Pontibacter russatus]
MKKYIAYYRVSTQKQGTSGLGLEAQKAAVAGFVAGAPVLAEYVEVESGKKDNRPELEKAIAHAKQAGATLIIAMLDRLSRNAGFIFALRDSKVDFICADMPDANTLTIGIFAVMAQHERELISKRTKDALAAKKARGEEVGNRANLTQKGRQKGAKARQTAAMQDKANKNALNWALECKAKKGEEKMTLQQIADKLNSMDLTTSTGAQFRAMSVKRLLDRHDKLQKEQEDFKFKIKQAEKFALHLKAVNLKVRIDEGLVYFEPDTKHTEPWPFTSLLFQQVIDKGAVLEYIDGYYALYADRSKREKLSGGSSFISLLGILADYIFRINMQKEHEASLHPDLIYISKGNPEKKQPPFVLSTVL